MLSLRYPRVLAIALSPLDLVFFKANDRKRFSSRDTPAPGQGTLTYIKADGEENVFCTLNDMPVSWRRCVYCYRALVGYMLALSRPKRL